MTRRIVSLALVGLLLVSSLAGPAAAAATASMTVQNDDEDCTPSRFSMGACTVETAPNTVDTSQTAEAIKTDMHVLMSGEWESQQAYLSLHQNYLQDTSTVASIDSKAVVADAWERGNSTVEATQDARESIRDYYARHQIQMLNAYQKQAMQASYTFNVSNRTSGIDGAFLSMALDVSGDQSTYDHIEYEAYQPLTTVDVTLVNGSTESITVPQIQVYLDTSTNSYYVPLDPFTSTYNTTTDEFVFERTSSHKPNVDITTSGTLVTQNVGDPSQGGLPSKRVADLREWRESWNEVKQQSQTLTSNYDSQFAEDLYAALDAGEITPEQVRGAEGQVRWLSGNSSVGDRRYQQATLSVLGVANANRSQANQMVVTYTGYTERGFSNSTDGSRDPVYSGKVENKTYTGMLFANPPTEGFQAGETYDVSTLEGTPTMYDNETGESVPLVKGNVTITGMYDAQGNEVENASWDEPQYETYNSTEYIEYINRSKTHRKYITNNYTTTTATAGGGVNLPDLGLGDFGGGSIFAGVGIMVIAGGAVVLVVLRG